MQSKRDNSPNLTQFWQDFDKRVLLLFAVPFVILGFSGMLFSPGSLSMTDPWIQLSQAMGLRPRSDWQPYIATSLLYLFGGHSSGTFVGYLFVQTVVWATAIGYLCQSLLSLRYLKISGSIILATVIPLYPLIFTISQDPTKDSMMAAFVMIISVYCLRIVESKGDWLKKPINAIMLTFLNFLVFEYRKNAFLIFGAILIVLLFKYRSHWKIILASLVGFIILVIIWSSLLSLWKVRPAPWSESLNMQLQQVSRVYVEDKEIPHEFRDHFEKLLSADEWKNRYQPNSTDPLRLGDGVSNRDIGFDTDARNQFLSDWMKLGMQYPELYLRAQYSVAKTWILGPTPSETQYVGKEFPYAFKTLDLPNWPLMGGCDNLTPVVESNGQYDNDGKPLGTLTDNSLRDTAKKCYAASYMNPKSPRGRALRMQDEGSPYMYNNISKMSESVFVNHINSVSGQHRDSIAPGIGEAYVKALWLPNNPIYVYIFANEAIPFWLLLTALVIGIIRRRFNALLFLPVFSYWITLPLAAPVGLIRYVLPVIVALPVLFAYVLKRRKLA